MAPVSKTSSSHALDGKGKHHVPGLFLLYEMVPRSPIKVDTLNVRELASKKKQSQVYRILTEHDIDVLAVQETKVDGEDETGNMVRRFTSRFFAVVSHARGTSAGCVIFVKNVPGLEV